MTVFEQSSSRDRDKSKKENGAQYTDPSMVGKTRKSPNSIYSLNATITRKIKRFCSGELLQGRGEWTSEKSPRPKKTQFPHPHPISTSSAFAVPRELEVLWQTEQSLPSQSFPLAGSCFALGFLSLLAFFPSEWFLIRSHTSGPER